MVDLSIFFCIIIFFGNISVLLWIASIWNSDFLASMKAAFGNKVITKETCSHFFVVWDFYLTSFFFTPSSLLSLHVPFCLTFLHSSPHVWLQ